MKKLIKFFLFGLLFFLTSCKGFCLDSIPYVISGDFVMEENSLDYEICGVDFFLINQSDKDIRKINVVFFLFDQDGEPAYECRNKISVVTELDIDAGESCNFIMSLDNFMNVIPSDPLLVDYLYLAEIEYEDGSVWQDPLGLIAFK